MIVRKQLVIAPSLANYREAMFAQAERDCSSGQFGAVEYASGAAIVDSEEQLIV